MGRNLHTLVRDLQRRKARERRGLVIAEGRRLVEETLASGTQVVALLAADDAATAGAAAVLSEAARRGIETAVVPRKEFDTLADTETPSGVLAVLKWTPLRLEDLPLADAARLLVLDGVQDPGNVGTMIRTAYALGAEATVALDGTADVRGPKVWRGAMGAALHHHVVEAPWAEFAAYASREGLALWAAVQGGEDVTKLAAPARLALVVGNEGVGLRAEVMAGAARRVAVPMRAGAESLNAAVAAGILLFEVLRAAP